MKVGAIVRCYYLTDFLPLILDNYKWMDKVLVPNVPFTGVQEMKDDTAEIVAQYPNATLFRTNLTEQHEIFNDSLAIMDEMDFVMITDADEYVSRETIDFILEYMDTKNIDYSFCSLIDYTAIDRAFIERGHQPIMVTRPKAIKFWEGRCIRGSGTAKSFNDKYIHHLGFMFNKEKIKWKTDNYWDPSNDFMACMKGERHVIMPKVLRNYCISRGFGCGQDCGLYG